MNISNWKINWYQKVLWHKLIALEKILNNGNEWSVAFLIYCEEYRKVILKDLLKHQLKTFDRS